MIIVVMVMVVVVITVVRMVNMMMVMAMDTFHWIEQRVFLGFEGVSVINVANHWC